MLIGLLFCYAFIVYSTQLVGEIAGTRVVPAWALRLSGSATRVHGVSRVTRLFIAGLMAVAPQVITIAALLTRRAELGIFGSSVFAADLIGCVLWTVVLVRASPRRHSSP